MFFIALIGILYWFIALISGYQLARHNHTLAAILPAGLAMLVIHQFDRGQADRTWLIAMYLFVALTLIGRGKYLRDRVAWMERGVHLAPEIGPDLSMGALVGAACAHPAGVEPAAQPDGCTRVGKEMAGRHPPLARHPRPAWTRL